jgi:membrane-associated phospholipid phosphatase
VMALAVLLPTLYLVKRRWNEPLLVAGAVGLETLVFVTAGFIIGRERPPVEQLDMSPPTASFPSGHTGAAVAFYLALLVVIYWWTRHRATRVGAAVVLVTVPIAVAISRLYRGMHYTTDVVFGAVVGMVSLAVFTAVLRPADAASDESESL